MKHNKKRNVGFIFEVLTKNYTTCVLKNNLEEAKKYSFVLKEFFNVGTTLGKALKCYSVIDEIESETDSLVKKSLLSEAVNQFARLDQAKLVTEQSLAIAKINRIFGKNIWDTFVPRYTSIATIDQLFKNTTNIKERILMESKICGTEEKQQIIKEEIDSIVFNKAVQKFNNKYSSKLNETQLRIVNQFIRSQFEPSAIVEMKEEISQVFKKLKEVAKTSKEPEIVSLVEDITKKKFDQIDEVAVEAVLTASSLLTELQK